MLAEIIYKINLLTINWILPLEIFLFITLLFSIFLSRNSIIKEFKKIPKKTWIALGIIFLLALALRITLPKHQHIMYVDEPWYMEATKNIIQTGSQLDYPKAIGWPFILTIPFFIFGINNYIAIYFNIFLGSISIIALFFLTRRITNSDLTSLFSCLLLAIAGDHIRWSSTAETNIPSLLFILLSLFALTIKDSTRIKIILKYSLIFFASTFRVEAILLILLLLVTETQKIFANKTNKNEIAFKLIIFTILSIIIIPYIAQTFTSQNKLDSLLELPYDTMLEVYSAEMKVMISDNISFVKGIISNEFISIALSLSIIAGAILYRKCKKNTTKIEFVIGYFILLFSLYFTQCFKCLGGGEYMYSKSRFYMMFYPATIIFASIPILWIENNTKILQKYRIKTQTILGVVITIIVLSQLVLLNQVPNMLSGPKHELKTRTFEDFKKDIDPECIFVSPMPSSITATTNLKAIYAPEFENYLREENINISNKCIMFYDDYICDTYQSSKNNPVRKSYDIICNKIRTNYTFIEYKNYTFENITYTLYRMTGKAE